MNSSIAIVTTVSNYRLYSRTSATFPTGLGRYVIDGSNGMHALDSIVYMMKRMRNHSYEWLILADEDVIFVDKEAVFAIIREMEKCGHTFCGVRDGGVIPHRTMNPHVVNMFFSVINIKEVLEIWNHREVLRNQYVHRNEFDDDLSDLDGEFDSDSLYEPYYCFYLWLRRKGKTGLFLHSVQPIPDDTLTSAVIGLDDQVALYHTWHARSYGRNEQHTRRIDRVLGLANPGLQALDATIYKDRTYALRKAASKAGIRFKYRLRRLITGFAD